MVEEYMKTFRKDSLKAAPRRSLEALLNKVLKPLVYPRETALIKSSKFLIPASPTIVTVRIQYTSIIPSSCISHE